MKSAPAWVAFDFDGTLTRRDSLLPFLRASLGTPRFLAALLAESPMLSAYAAGVVGNERAKQALLRRCLGGMDLGALECHGSAFARQRIPSLLRPEMMRLFEAHRRDGHVCALVTASIDIYIQPWAEAAGFHHVICSRLEIDADAHVTGRLAEGNCYGQEKARRLRSLLSIAGADLHAAYGDSRGDREMLAMAKRKNYKGRWLP